MTHLSLQHHVPLFKKAGIDLDKFLKMSETDFQRLGLDDPRDLGLLSNCSRALSIHIQQERDSISIKEEDDDDTPLLTPSSILNAIHAFDSDPTIKSSPSPPAIVVIPSVQTNTSSAHDFQPPPVHNGYLVPGTPPQPTLRPRFTNGQNKQTNTRPVSMPIQLPSFSTSPPPPDYASWPPSIYGKRLDRCRSMIFPREEEGKEELPPYTCTVFKMGYVYVKKEYDTPGVKSRYRGWR